MLKNIAFAIVVLFLASGWFRSCQNEQLTKEQNVAINSELVKTVDKLGRANFEVKSFEGQALDLNQVALSKDSTLARLTALLNERGKRNNVRAAVSFNASAKGRAVGVSIVSGAYTSGRVDTVLAACPPDTSTIRALVSSPKFSATEPPTFSGQVVARRDSTFVDPYVVRVGFDVVQTETKGSVTTTIRPTDPNVEVTTARSFTQELPKKNRGFWAGVGAVAVIALTLLLPK